MAQRRSLTDSISPLAAEFIKQGTVQPALIASEPREIIVPKLSPAREPEPTPPESSALITVSYRLPESLVIKLVRESTERKIKKLRPWTQQEIMAVALQEWLSRNQSK
jgi:hypothetical protein